MCVPNRTSAFPHHCVLQVLTPEQQRAFCRIGALIRGFLTRRLLKTEKVKHLSQTIVVSSLFNWKKHPFKGPPNLYKGLHTCVQDTQEFIRSFQTEAQNRGAYSAQDHSLHERLRAQVRMSASTDRRALLFFRLIDACVLCPSSAQPSMTSMTSSSCCLWGID